MSAPDFSPRECGTSSSMRRAAGRPTAANRPASMRWSTASSVTANGAGPTRPSTSAGYESAISDTSTSGGSADTGQKAVTVVPMSSLPSAIVRRVTAPAQASNACRTPGCRVTEEAPRSL